MKQLTRPGRPGPTRPTWGSSPPCGGGGPSTPSWCRQAWVTEVRLLVVPPRADPTLAIAAAGWRVLDLERAYAERILQAGALAREAGAAAGTDRAARRLMLLLAAAELLDAPGPQTRLRAAGAAYAGACDPDSGLALRLDDLELTAGTTERLADVLALPAGRSP